MEGLELLQHQKDSSMQRARVIEIKPLDYLFITVFASWRTQHFHGICPRLGVKE